MPIEFYGCAEIHIITYAGQPARLTTEQPTHSLLCHHWFLCSLDTAKGVEKGLRQVWVTWEEVNLEFDSAVCRYRR